MRRPARREEPGDGRSVLGEDAGVAVDREAALCVEEGGYHLDGLARAGTRLFWRVEPWPDAAPERLARYTPADAMPAAPSRPLETAATVLLLGYGIAMVLAASPLLDYTRAAAAQLQSPADYVQQVRAATPAARTP